MKMEVKKLSQIEEVSRFCRLSKYNQFRILEEVKKMLVNEGAVLLINQYQKMIEYTCISSDCREEDFKRKLQELKKIKIINHDLNTGGCLYFILNGYYYYISFDDNPFFPIMYKKIKIDDEGGYVGERYIYSTEELNEKTFKKTGHSAISIAYDCLWGIMSEEDVAEVADDFYQKLKKYIIDGAEAQIVNEKKRVYYSNNKYYYTYVFDDKKLNVLKDRYSKDKNAYYILGGE